MSDSSLNAAAAAKLLDLIKYSDDNPRVQDMLFEKAIDVARKARVQNAAANGYNKAVSTTTTQEATITASHSDDEEATEVVPTVSKKRAIGVHQPEFVSFITSQQEPSYKVKAKAKAKETPKPQSRVYDESYTESEDKPKPQPRFDEESYTESDNIQKDFSLPPENVSKKRFVGSVKVDKFVNARLPAKNDVRVETLVNSSIDLKDAYMRGYDGTNAGAAIMTGCKQWMLDDWKSKKRPLTGKYVGCIREAVARVLIGKYDRIERMCQFLNIPIPMQSRKKPDTPDHDQQASLESDALKNAYITSSVIKFSFDQDSDGNLHAIPPGDN